MEEWQQAAGSLCWMCEGETTLERQKQKEGIIMAKEKPNIEKLDVRYMRVLWELYKHAYKNNVNATNSKLKCPFPVVYDIAEKADISSYVLCHKMINVLAETDLITIEYAKKKKNTDTSKWLLISLPVTIEEITKKYRNDCLQSLEILRNICNRRDARCHYIDDDFYDILNGCAKINIPESGD